MDGHLNLPERIHLSETDKRWNKIIEKYSDPGFFALKPCLSFPKGGIVFISDGKGECLMTSEAQQIFYNYGS